MGLGAKVGTAPGSCKWGESGRKNRSLPHCPQFLTPSPPTPILSLTVAWSSHAERRPPRPQGKSCKQARQKGDLPPHRGWRAPGQSREAFSGGFGEITRGTLASPRFRDRVVTTAFCCGSWHCFVYARRQVRLDVCRPFYIHHSP